MEKVNIFVDMDGVLAEQREDMVEHMYNKGLFLNLPPIMNMVNSVKKLTRDSYRIYILSSVIDSPYCEPEKEMWLDEYLPEIDKSNRIFVPYGVVKSTYAKNKVDTRGAINVLIDDFTVNLTTWELPGALAIKVLNGMNSTKGTWLDNGGHYIYAHESVDNNVSRIRDLIANSQVEVLKKAL